MPPARALQFKPTQTVRFVREGASAVGELIVGNSTDAPVAIKVKTNAAERYMVRPHIGVLGPNDEVKITFTVKTSFMQDFLESIRVQRGQKPSTAFLVLQWPLSNEAYEAIGSRIREQGGDMQDVMIGQAGAGGKKGSASADILSRIWKDSEAANKSAMSCVKFTCMLQEEAIDEDGGAAPAGSGAGVGVGAGVAVGGGRDSMGMQADESSGLRSAQGSTALPPPGRASMMSTAYGGSMGVSSPSGQDLNGSGMAQEGGARERAAAASVGVRSTPEGSAGVARYSPDEASDPVYNASYNVQGEGAGPGDNNNYRPSPRGVGVGVGGVSPRTGLRQEEYPLQGGGEGAMAGAGARAGPGEGAYRAPVAPGSNPRNNMMSSNIGGNVGGVTAEEALALRARTNEMDMFGLQSLAEKQELGMSVALHAEALARAQEEIAALKEELASSRTVTGSVRLRRRAAATAEGSGEGTQTAAVDDEDDSTVKDGEAGDFPLWQLLLVALIAFLVGRLSVTL